MQPSSLLIFPEAKSEGSFPAGQYSEITLGNQLHVSGNVLPASYNILSDQGLIGGNRQGQSMRTGKQSVNTLYKKQELELGFVGKTTARPNRQALRPVISVRKPC
ncbi:hypothetical protein [Pseudomonas syringae]|uniref:hypothetical protein n=1 Tax=Pseudomonas syringae TaxID=317 RepID=UPI0013797DE8|nr:hypothetical protein [Pseudomonas syringae]